MERIYIHHGKLTSYQHAKPGAQLEDSDEPPLFVGVGYCVTHSIAKGRHPVSYMCDLAR